MGDVQLLLLSEGKFQWSCLLWKMKEVLWMFCFWILHRRGLDDEFLHDRVRGIAGCQLKVMQVLEIGRYEAERKSEAGNRRSSFREKSAPPEEREEHPREEVAQRGAGNCWGSEPLQSLDLCRESKRWDREVAQRRCTHWVVSHPLTGSFSGPFSHSGPLNHVSH